MCPRITLHYSPQSGGRAEPSKIACAMQGPGRSSTASAGSPSEHTGLRTAAPSCRKRAKGRGCRDSGAGPEQLGLLQRGAEKCSEQGRSSPSPWGGTCDGSQEGEDGAQSFGACWAPGEGSPASLQAGGRGVSIVVGPAVLWPRQPAREAVSFPCP